MVVAVAKAYANVAVELLTQVTRSRMGMQLEVEPGRQVGGRGVMWKGDGSGRRGRGWWRVGEGWWRR
jgi:hypothetical protein